MGSSHRFSSALRVDVKGKGIQFDDDDDTILLEEEDDSHIISEFRMSLIGKILNPKKQIVEKLIKAMPTQWGLQERITANDLGNGKFLFNFTSEEDLKYILSLGPFHYNFCMFVLVRWEPMVHDDYPWIIPFWVEISGIPLHLWTVTNLKNIGRKLGHVDTIELSAGRLLIDVDTRKPMLFNKKVQSREGDEVNIHFKYDLLFKHCSHCGFLTHEVAYCPTKLEEQRLQAKEAGVFSRVHLPFEPPSRQSLLADRTERDRYHNWSDRQYENRKGYKSEGNKSDNYGSRDYAYGNWRDDRQGTDRERPRDTVVRRAGDRSSSTLHMSLVRSKRGEPRT